MANKRRTSGSARDISLSDIARQLRIKPRHARARLRRRPEVKHRKGQAWQFTEAEAKKVKELLRA